MKIIDNEQGAFYVASAAYNKNTVIITDTGEYGCLKVLANADKYFRSYYPDFYRIGADLTKKKLTNKLLKEIFIHSIEYDYKWTVLERETLARYFKVNIDFLSEKKRPKNYQTGSTNKALDKKRKAKAPGKRISATGRTYTERRKNRSDARPKYRL